jgi:hypothetical protein
MRSFLSGTLVIVSLVVISQSEVRAAEPAAVQEPKITSGEQKADLPLIAQMKKKLRSMSLSPEVLAQATKIVDKYGPQYVAAQRKRQTVLTDVQREIQAGTAKANQAAGKTGRDVLEGIQEAIKLTPEQKAQWDTAENEKNAVGAKLYDALRAILTPEQQQEFGVPKKGNSAYAD